MRIGTVIIISAGAVAAAIVAFLAFYMPVERVVEKQPEVVVNEAGSPVVEPAGLEGYDQTKVVVNGVQLVTDIADTPEKKSKGLAVRDSMNENEAMLFLFDTEGRHAFWMKGMKFPIDIIWLDSNKQVVHVEHSLEPCGITCPNYNPQEESLYVLETVAGFANKYNVVAGTSVEFQLGS